MPPLAGSEAGRRPRVPVPRGADPGDHPGLPGELVGVDRGRGGGTLRAAPRPRAGRGARPRGRALPQARVGLPSRGAQEASPNRTRPIGARAPTERQPDSRMAYDALGYCQAAMPHGKHANVRIAGSPSAWPRRCMALSTIAARASGSFVRRRDWPWGRSASRPRVASTSARQQRQSGQRSLDDDRLAALIPMTMVAAARDRLPRRSESGSGHTPRAIGRRSMLPGLHNGPTRWSRRL